MTHPDRDATPDHPSGGAPGAGLPRNVVALGWTSLLTDVSSEMLVPVMPLFVTGVLHASVASLGVIEGVAESTGSALRIVSGWLSDRLGRRKPFLVFGYGLSGLAKAAMAFAASWPMVLASRFADRVGKGLRNPPRDALLADSVAPGQRGRAFGLHRAMDTLGAAIGPLVAFAVLQAFPGDYRRIFLLSAIPAALSVAVLIAFVRAPRAAPAPVDHASGGAEAGARAAPLGAPFRRFLVADGVFQLGNSSNAFILLRASQVGLSAGQVALAYFAYNVFYALLSYPLGGLSDRIGRRPLLLAAYGLYAVVYGLLAATVSAGALLAALLLLGLHSALLEGQQRSLVADLVPAGRRGTAYGVYHTVVGAALLPASIIGGALWERRGPSATFALGAACAIAAAGLFALLLPASGERAERHA